MGRLQHWKEETATHERDYVVRCVMEDGSELTGFLGAGTAVRLYNAVRDGAIPGVTRVIVEHIKNKEAMT